MHLHYPHTNYLLLLLYDDFYDKLFLQNVWPKVLSLISSHVNCSNQEVLTIANPWHAVNTIWTWVEPEFRLHWIKLCSSDNPLHLGGTAPATFSFNLTWTCYCYCLPIFSHYHQSMNIQQVHIYNSHLKL